MCKQRVCEKTAKRKFQSVCQNTIRYHCWTRQNKQSQPQIRLDRATGIAGVVLRGADASALAARWAALVGVAATADAQGRLQLLPGGFIAFEAAAPGEADGLTDIVLQAVDPAPVLHQAASLGAPVTAGGLVLAGVRFSLTSAAPTAG